MSVEIPDLALISLASRFRVAMRIPEVQEIHSRIQQHCFQDGLIMAMLPCWYDRVVAPLSVSQVMSAYEAPALRPLIERRPGNAQAAALRALRRQQSTQLVRGAFRRRVLQWIPDLPESALLQLPARLRFVSQQGGSVFSYNVVRTLTRGWCTSHRFGIGEKLCVFGCGGPDRFQHYVDCALLFSAELVQFLGALFSDGRSSYLESLCLVLPRPRGLSRSWDIVAAIVLESIHFSYTTCTLNGRGRQSSVLVEARLAEWSRRSPRLRTLLAEYFFFRQRAR